LRAKWFLSFSFLVLLASSILFIGTQLGTAPNHWGWLNLFIFLSIIAWYLLDVMVARRSIYRFLGDAEDPIKPEIRLFRKVVLLASALLGASAASLAILYNGPPPPNAPPIYIPKGAQNSLLVLTGIFLAAFGWMYTGFQKEKADRVTNTLQVIRDQMYGDHVSTVYRQMTALMRHARKADDVPNEGILPMHAFAIKLVDIPEENRPEGPRARTLEYLTVQFMNALDHIAFGVRQGQFDLRTVEMVLRPRFIRHAFVFANYIEDSTNAKTDTRTGRLRAQTRTWEHLLWLVTKLPVLKSDDVDESKIILPPDHIVDEEDDAGIDGGAAEDVALARIRAQREAQLCTLKARLKRPKIARPGGLFLKRRRGSPSA